MVTQWGGWRRLEAHNQWSKSANTARSLAWSDTTWEHVDFDASVLPEVFSLLTSASGWAGDQTKISAFRNWFNEHKNDINYDSQMPDDFPAKDKWAEWFDIDNDNGVMYVWQRLSPEQRYNLLTDAYKAQLNDPYGEPMVYTPGLYAIQTDGSAAGAFPPLKKKDTKFAKMHFVFDEENDPNHENPIGWAFGDNTLGGNETDRNRGVYTVPDTQAGPDTLLFTNNYRVENSSPDPTPSSTKLDEPFIHKSIVPNNATLDGESGDGTYTLGLNINGISKDTYEHEKLDVLFVLDTSNSMAYNKDTRAYTTNETFPTNSRYAVAREALLKAIDGIYDLNDIDPNMVNVNIFDFATIVMRRDDNQWTNDRDALMNWATSGKDDQDGPLRERNQYDAIPSKGYYRLDGATNWEDALLQAKESIDNNNHPSHQGENVRKIVIFVTDGNPTISVNENQYTAEHLGITPQWRYFVANPDSTIIFSPGQYYEGFRPYWDAGKLWGHGAEEPNNILEAYEMAKAPAKALVDEGVELYTIGIFGGSELLKNLLAYAYNEDDVAEYPQGHYYNAETSEDVARAFDEIVKKLQGNFNFTDVKIEDSITNLTSTALDKEPNAFAYYRWLEDGNRNIYSADSLDEYYNLIRWYTDPVTGEETQLEPIGYTDNYEPIYDETDPNYINSYVDDPTYYFYEGPDGDVCYSFFEPIPDGMTPEEYVEDGGQITRNIYEWIEADYGQWDRKDNVLDYTNPDNPTRKEIEVQEATYDSGARKVTWDMKTTEPYYNNNSDRSQAQTNNYILDKNWTYAVTFQVWPSQQMYDYVADWNNYDNAEVEGNRDNLTNFEDWDQTNPEAIYVSQDPNAKQEGGKEYHEYWLKTNVRNSATATYTQLNSETIEEIKKVEFEEVVREIKEDANGVPYYEEDGVYYNPNTNEPYETGEVNPAATDETISTITETVTANVRKDANGVEYYMVNGKYYNPDTGEEYGLGEVNPSEDDKLVASSTTTIMKLDPNTILYNDPDPIVVSDTQIKITKYWEDLLDNTKLAQLIEDDPNFEVELILLQATHDQDKVDPMYDEEHNTWQVKYIYPHIDPVTYDAENNYEGAYKIRLRPIWHYYGETYLYGQTSGITVAEYYTSKGKEVPDETTEHYNHRHVIVDGFEEGTINLPVGLMVSNPYHFGGDDPQQSGYVEYIVTYPVGAPIPTDTYTAYATKYGWCNDDFENNYKNYGYDTLEELLADWGYSTIEELMEANLVDASKDTGEVDPVTGQPIYETIYGRPGADFKDSSLGMNAQVNADGSVTVHYWMLEEGYHYMLRETNRDYAFTLDSQVYHPFLIDSVLYDVNCDYENNTGYVVSHVKDYNQTGDSTNSYWLKETGLSATNKLRPHITLEKLILDGNNRFYYQKNPDGTVKKEYVTYTDEGEFVVSETATGAAGEYTHKIRPDDEFKVHIKMELPAKITELGRLNYAKYPEYVDYMVKEGLIDREEADAYINHIEKEQSYPSYVRLSDDPEDAKYSTPEELAELRRRKTANRELFYIIEGDILLNPNDRVRLYNVPVGTKVTIYEDTDHMAEAYGDKYELAFLEVDWAARQNDGTYGQMNDWFCGDPDILADLERSRQEYADDPEAAYPEDGWTQRSEQPLIIEEIVEYWDINYDVDVFNYFRPNVEMKKVDVRTSIETMELNDESTPAGKGDMVDDAKTPGLSEAQFTLYRLIPGDSAEEVAQELSYLSDAEQATAVNASTVKEIRENLGNNLKDYQKVTITHTKVHKSDGTYEDRVLENIETDDNGKYEFGYLRDGIYYLVETKAPTGYMKDDRITKITVNSDVGVKYQMLGTPAKEEKDAYLRTEYDDKSVEKKIYEIVVEDEKTYVLPSAGGIGTLWNTVIGTCFLALGVFYIFKYRYQKRGVANAG